LRWVLAQRRLRSGVGFNRFLRADDSQRMIAECRTYDALPDTMDAQQ
jgi:hypothetical protein